MTFSGPNLIAISVGNTRTQAGLFLEGQLAASEHFAHEDLAAIVHQIAQWWEQVRNEPRPAVALASVNDHAADRLDSAVDDQLSIEVYRVGRDLPIPIATDLDPETITGADRLLNAAAAFDRIEQACIIVDAGTAVTVDFVDGEGTFHGGAIAPGARMQLRAMHDSTTALPELDFQAPSEDAFGRSTSQAMLRGVYHGIRGLVWRLVETYAERYGAFPMVIATGGDSDLLFKDDELIDRIVPELTLLGICVAARDALAADDAKK